MDARGRFLGAVFACVLLAGMLPGLQAIAGGGLEKSEPAAENEHAQLVRRGAEVYQRCSACHRLGANAQNRIGPQLNDLLGRKAGSIEGARYSPAMKQAGADGLVWSAETIDAFVADPKGYLKGTTMGLRGVEDAGDRKALVAYLSSFSTGPSNIPETTVPAPPPVDAGVPSEILALKGDPEYGEYLSGECVTCHQPSGADKGIPSIIGWPHEDFVIAMHAYKNKKRPHPVMRMIAGRLSPEEIAALAAYFNKRDR
ncbi:MAG: c-type cytochrome [Alphaproteobacteria bacterium]|nr:c-type cytochrome [Alphaproteobacteria bacterium]